MVRQIKSVTEEYSRAGRDLIIWFLSRRTLTPARQTEFARKALRGKLLDVYRSGRGIEPIEDLTSELSIAPVRMTLRDALLNRRVNG